MQRIRSFPDEATKIKFIVSVPTYRHHNLFKLIKSFMVSLLFIGIGAFLLYIVSDFYSYIENHPPYQMNTFTYKSRTIVQLNDRYCKYQDINPSSSLFSVVRKIYLFYVIFCFVQYRYQLDFCGFLQR